MCSSGLQFTVYIFIFYLFIYVCGVCVSLYVNVFAGEAARGQPHFSSSTTFHSMFEKGSFIEPQTCHFGQTSWPTSHVDPPVFAHFLAVGLQVCTTMPTFDVGARYSSSGTHG